MKEPRSDLARDLKALQYTDALDAGDLETVAALWDEASRDPQLEQLLAELDGALFVEEAGRDRGPGAVVEPRPTRRRWAVALCGAAAAGVLAFLAWTARDDEKPSPIPQPDGHPHVVVTRPRENDVGIAAWRQYRRALDGEDIPAFTWPVQGNVGDLGIRLDPSGPALSRDRVRSL
jgi:hypothetical protein